MTRQKQTEPPHWPSHLVPAPGDLRIVQVFINTTDGRQAPDLATPEDLGEWLALWDLAPRGSELTAADLARALEVRAALRTLVAAPDGGAASDEAAACLARTATVRLRFVAGGRFRFEPTTGGLDGALARLCAFVAEAQIQDTWPRLKICDVCRTAFFDLSKNRAARRCSRRCSSRVSTRHYRRRHLEEVRRYDAATARVRRHAP